MDVSNVNLSPEDWVMKFMYIPFWLARIFGVYVPLPDNMLMYYLYRMMFIVLSYFYATVLTLADKRVTFFDIIDVVGDFLIALIMVIFLAETIRKGEYLMSGLMKVEKIEKDLIELGKKPIGRSLVGKKLLARFILQSLAFGFGMNTECEGMTIPFVVQNLMMNIVSLYFFSTWLILTALLGMSSHQFEFLIKRLKAFSLPFTNHYQQGKLKNWNEQRDMIKYHAQVCWAIGDLSEWFELSFLCYSAYFFYATTFGFYVMTQDVVSLVSMQTLCVVNGLLTHILWTLARAIELWSILDVIRLTEKQSQDFTNYLHDVMTKSGDKVEGIFKLHFILKPRVNFWAKGFFKIDNTLIYSMVGSAATYLTVIFQSVSDTGTFGSMLQHNTSKHE